MSAYWAQFTHDEIMSMHGIEPDDELQDDLYLHEISPSDDELKNECPRCWRGCSYCLMTEW